MIIKDKIYGEFKVSDVIKDIISTKIIQRLKKIHQNGADFLVNPKRNATRYDHSIGVLFLIKKLGGSEEEQIAGLLHDISHTAFSHTCDIVMNNKNEDFHEKNKILFSNDEEIMYLLKKNAIDVTAVFNEKKHMILEKDIPDLCADRLDYFLRDMYNVKRLSKKQIKKIITDLIFEDRVVKCKSIAIGKLLTAKFIELSEYVFYNAKSEAANLALSWIISSMIKSNELKINDLFCDDFHIISKIKKSKYSKQFNLINHNIRFRNVENTNNITLIKHRKHRYVDPIVSGVNERVSKLDKKSKNKIEVFLKIPKISYYEIDVINKQGDLDD